MASPLGFAETTRVYYRTVLLPRLRSAGYEPLDPWRDDEPSLIAAQAAVNQAANEQARRQALARLDSRAGARNVELLEAAQGVLAVLDGVDVDSGTAAEIGFAAARGLPVVGLRTDLRQSGENDGCLVNLQVQYFITASGGAIAQNLEEAIALLGRLLPVSQPDLPSLPRSSVSHG